MASHKISINDIARKSGLSITTVSRVLNGKSKEFRISKETERIIRKTARELNYVPNQFAANLKSGKSHTIALIIPSLSNPFFAEIASEINSEIRNRGFTALIGDSDENMDIENDELMQMESRNIEGLVIVPCSQDWGRIKDIYDRGTPVVCIDRYFEDLPIPYVSTDNYLGAIMGTRHLLDHGHRDIACVQGVEHSVPNKLRIKGFTDAMHNAGLKSFSITGNDFSEKNGYKETKVLLQSGRRPTAIFTLSNTIAMGCLQALREEGFRVPEDISILTFDDHPYLDHLSTPLSCIKQPTREICQIAIKNLFFMLNKKEVKHKHVLLKPELIYRKSVKHLKV